MIARITWMHLVGLALAACSSNTQPPPVARRVPPTDPAPAAPPPDAAPPAPVATGSISGPCRAQPAPTGDRRAPHEVAACPDPTAMHRGDGIPTTEGAPKVTPTKLPPWDLETDRDFACAYACAANGATAHLLAWSIIEDDRPLRNHNAAFLVEDPSAPEKWTVVVMYRHATNTWWNIDASFHSRSEPIVHFKDRPSARQVDDVLARNRWMYDHEIYDGGFMVLAGNVIDDVWTTALRGPSPRHFPAGIEQ
jgi:hypothetical protein